MSAARALAAIVRRHEAARVSVNRRYLRDLVHMRGAHDWATQTTREPLSREEMNRRRAARRARRAISARVRDAAQDDRTASTTTAHSDL